jgi:hypothetical protein
MRSFISPAVRVGSFFSEVTLFTLLTERAPSVKDVENTMILTTYTK